jgi:hypothetical protein
MGTDPAIGAILLEFDVIAVTTRDTKTWPLKTFRMLQRIVPLGKSLRTSHLATATAHAFVKIHSDLLCARKFDDHTGTGIHETTLLWIHHPGENRSPYVLEVYEETGFRVKLGVTMKYSHCASDHKEA